MFSLPYQRNWCQTKRKPRLWVGPAHLGQIIHVYTNCKQGFPVSSPVNRCLYSSMYSSWGHTHDMVMLEIICSGSAGDKWAFRLQICCLMLQCKTLLFLYSRSFFCCYCKSTRAFILVQLWCLQLMHTKYCKEPMTSACTIKKCFLTYKIFHSY